MGIIRKKISEEEFKSTIEILQQLQKINAPENFEFNLMTKIQNQDFGELQNDEKRLRFGWILPPAFAVVLTTVVLLFVLYEKAPEPENLLLSPPTLRLEYQAAKKDKRGTVEYVAEETSESVTSANEKQKNVVNSNYLTSGGEKNFKVVLQENDVVVRKKEDFPFNNSANVDLDSYLSGSGRSSNLSSGAQLVGEKENYPVFDFNGFFIRERLDRKVLEKYRSRMDSLKNAEKRK